MFEIGQPEVASSVAFNVLVSSHDEVLLLVQSKSAGGGGKDNKKFIPICISLDRGLLRVPVDVEDYSNEQEGASIED